MRKNHDLIVFGGVATATTDVFFMYGGIFKHGFLNSSIMYYSCD